MKQRTASRKRRTAKLPPLYLVLNEFNDDLRCFQWVRLYTTQKCARLCARAQKPRGRIVAYVPRERKHTK